VRRLAFKEHLQIPLTFAYRSCPGSHRRFGSCEEARDNHPEQESEDGPQSLLVIIYSVTNVPRKASAGNSTLGITSRAVNYDDKSELVEALQGIHTVLSFIQLLSDPENKSQKNLIDAAVVAGVNRFAPSEWGRQVNSDEWCKGDI
jgi:hypothetical protein